MPVATSSVRRKDTPVVLAAAPPPGDQPATLRNWKKQHRCGARKWQTISFVISCSYPSCIGGGATSGAWIVSARGYHATCFNA